jgi:hypothetical protein
VHLQVFTNRKFNITILCNASHNCLRRLLADSLRPSNEEVAQPIESFRDPPAFTKPILLFDTSSFSLSILVNPLAKTSTHSAPWLRYCGQIRESPFVPNPPGPRLDQPLLGYMDGNHDAT